MRERGSRQANPAVEDGLYFLTQSHNGHPEVSGTMTKTFTVPSVITRKASAGSPSWKSGSPFA